MDLDREGRREGPLLGGCLDSLEHLRGTRFWPDWHGAIFFFFETSEEAPSPARVDAIRSDYGNMGILASIAAMIGDHLVGEASRSVATAMGTCPLSTWSAEIMDAPGVGGLGGTFGGNPVCLAAAHPVLDQMEVLLARAQAVGRRVAVRAASWKERFTLVGEARGLGAMWGIELVKDRLTKAPAREETAAVARACYERGLVTITAGTWGNVNRTLMPLVIRDEELEEGLDVLETALASVLR